MPGTPRRGAWLSALLALATTAGGTAARLLTGTGRADVTGPAAEAGLMGYAKPSQTAGGIRQRTYARALAVKDERKACVVFVNVDVCMASDVVTKHVVERLQPMEECDVGLGNLMISGVHTHAAPAGFLQYALYQITSLGFVHETFEAMVQGIVDAVEDARRSLEPAVLRYAEGDVDADGVQINRSPTAHARNPSSERAFFHNDTVDRTMRLVWTTPLGQEDPRRVTAPSVSSARHEPTSLSSLTTLVSFFAVHGTSLPNTNRLLAGDNKGYAAHELERAARAKGVPLNALFVATNLGDVSPNARGAFCGDTGVRCDANTSTCGGRSESCLGRGWYWPDAERSTRHVGEVQAKVAMQLVEGGGGDIGDGGPVAHAHRFVEFDHGIAPAVPALAPHPAMGGGALCSPALGYSFAAGTTDGPGDFDFTQGTVKGNAFWDLVSKEVTRATPTAAEIACQHPKPILLNVGRMNHPYPWVAHVLPVQVLRIGHLFIVGVPFELTTMAGRRLRSHVSAAVATAVPEARVVLAGLANSYAGYCTTPEEYVEQRYEGASTLFGPHQLARLIVEAVDLAKSIVRTGRGTTGAPPPPDLLDRQLSFLPPVLFDSAPPGASFGEVLRCNLPKLKAAREGDSVWCEFHAANPRNDRSGNAFSNGTFAAVEAAPRLDGPWERVLDDADFDLAFSWHPGRVIGVASPFSTARVMWNVRGGVEGIPRTGWFRLRYFGTAKHVNGAMRAFAGVSDAFAVALDRAV